MFRKTAKVSLLVVIALSIFGSARAHAVVCLREEGDINSGFDYFLAFSESLGKIKLAADEVGSVARQKEDPNFVTELMAALKTSSQYLQCASTTLERFQGSKNEMISKGSRKMIESIRGILSGNEYQLTKVRAVLSDDVKRSPAETAERDSDNQVATNEAWQNLALSSASVTWAVTNGTAKKLSITKQQRDQLVSKLESYFGKKSIRRKIVPCR